MINKINKSLFFVISLFVLLLGCADEAPTQVKVKLKNHTLPVTLVKQEQLPVFYRAIGTVISDKRVDITSRVTGFIKEILNLLLKEKADSPQAIINLLEGEDI